MTSHVAFLRAVNVAGHATIKKDALADAFRRAGCRDVATFLQSGNVIYEAAAREQPRLAKRIAGELERQVGGPVIVTYRTLRHLAALVRADPFADVDTDSDVKLYAAFLAGRPSKQPVFPLEDEKEKLRALYREGSDVFVVSGKKPNGFYGFPNNFIEARLGVTATTRNWNTVARIVRKFG